jgi:hypothetical protein
MLFYLLAIGDLLSLIIGWLSFSTQDTESTKDYELMTKD